MSSCEVCYCFRSLFVFVFRLSMVHACSMDFEWHRSESAHLQSLTKRKRIDFHVKQFVLKGAVEAGLASTVGQSSQSAAIDRALSVRWRESEMSAYRASTILAFKAVDTLSICFDCARLGKPAKEVLVVTISSPGQKRHGMLPPQVDMQLTSWGASLYSASLVGLADWWGRGWGTRKKRKYLSFWFLDCILDLKYLRCARFTLSAYLSGQIGELKVYLM